MTLIHQFAHHHRKEYVVAPEFKQCYGAEPYLALQSNQRQRNEAFVEMNSLSVQLLIKYNIVTPTSLQD